MTRIEEFENRMIENGIGAEDYREYEKMLRRVNGNFLRLQHCYATAARFLGKRSKQAVELIEWGIKRYPDTWFAMYTAYCNIGFILQRCGEYRLAYDAFLKADGFPDKDKTAYHQSAAGNLMWMLLHIDGFEYSEQLERYYNTFKETDGFASAFINCEFRLAVAAVVIFRHKGMENEAMQAYEKALRLRRPGAVSRMRDILKSHKAEDILEITPECERFLKKVRI